MIGDDFLEGSSRPRSLYRGNMAGTLEKTNESANRAAPNLQLNRCGSNRDEKRFDLGRRIADVLDAPLA